MNRQGRPTQPVEALSIAPSTFTGNRALRIEEALIFEIGRPEVTGVDLDEPADFTPRLGGLAIAVVTIYGGYRTLVYGAAPGEFFGFLAAFLMAYEPARRLARLNLDLSSGLVGVRLLFEILDSPPSEAPDDDKPALRPSIEIDPSAPSGGPGDPILYQALKLLEK